MVSIDVFMVHGFIALVTTMGIWLRCFILGVFQEAFSTVLRSLQGQHQYRECTRKSSVLSARGYRKSQGRIQSPLQHCEKFKSSVWTDGLDHMATHQKFKIPLGKRRYRHAIHRISLTKKTNRNQCLLRYHWIPGKGQPPQIPQIPQYARSQIGLRQSKSVNLHRYVVLLQSSNSAAHTIHSFSNRITAPDYTD